MGQAGRRNGARRVHVSAEDVAGGRTLRIWYPAQTMTQPDLEIRTFVIEGQNFSDISGFYREINRVFMADEDWQLGESLDALDDLFHGGYGALAGAPGVILHWRACDKSQGALGLAATLNWLEAKLARPGQFAVGPVQAQIAALRRGEGKTYFDIVVEIIESHSQIRLLRE